MGTLVNFEKSYCFVNGWNEFKSPVTLIHTPLFLSKNNKKNSTLINGRSSLPSEIESPLYIQTQIIFPNILRFLHQ